MGKKNLLKIALLFTLTFSLLTGCGKTEPKTTSVEKKETLFVYCAAGLSKPLEDMAKLFEEKHNVKIEYTFANSSELISQMEISKKGDLCILASNEDYDTANDKKLTTNKVDLVYNTPVIAVPKGNPANIKSLKDFANPGVKVILGDPEVTPLGKLAFKLFEKAGIKEEVKSNIVSTVTKVSETITFLSMKKGDASIVWENNALGASDDLDIVYLPENENLVKVVPISTLESSKNKDLAQKFIDFTTSAEGLSVFEKNNLKPVK